MSSLTSEQYELISGLLAVFVTHKKHGRPKTRLIIHFLVDYEEALNRAREVDKALLCLRDYDFTANNKEDGKLH